MIFAAMPLVIGACAREPRAVAPEVLPPPPPSVAPPVASSSASLRGSQPQRRAYPDIVTLANVEDEADATTLVQLVEEGVAAWVLLRPSGDDLSATMLIASDRRRGKEAITEAACRAQAAYFKKGLPDAPLAPRPIIDVDACGTQTRAVVRQGTGAVPRPTWIKFIVRQDGDPPGHYPRMLEYGEATELWVWGLVPLAAGQKQDKDVPVGWNVDALYMGVDMPLIVPELE
jgi:hypothetical protein